MTTQTNELILKNMTNDELIIIAEQNRKELNPISKELLERLKQEIWNNENIFLSYYD